MLENTLVAAEELEKRGIQTRVVDLHTIKPLDKKTVLTAAKKCGAIVTCEENSVIGGMGSIVASFLSEELPTPIRMIGIRDVFGQSGAYDVLREHYKLSPRHIVKAAYAAMSAKRKGRKEIPNER